MRTAWMHIRRSAETVPHTEAPRFHLPPLLPPAELPMGCVSGDGKADDFLRQIFRRRLRKVPEVVSGGKVYPFGSGKAVRVGKQLGKDLRRAQDVSGVWRGAVLWYILKTQIVAQSTPDEWDSLFVPFKRCFLLNGVVYNVKRSNCGLCNITPTEAAFPAYQVPI